MPILNPHTILYPLFAMFLLVVLVMLTMAFRRLHAVRTQQLSPSFLKLYEGSVEPPAVRQASRNYSNLFEAPVLFYVACIVIFITGSVDTTAVGLAWLFVTARYLHSLIHLTTNTVSQRFAAFALSQVVLLILWIRLGIAIYRVHG